MGSCRQNTTTCHILEKLRFCIQRLHIHPLHRNGQKKLKRNSRTLRKGALNTADACEPVKRYFEKIGLLTFQRGWDPAAIFSRIWPITISHLFLGPSRCQRLTLIFHDTCAHTSNTLHFFCESAACIACYDMSGRLKSPFHQPAYDNDATCTIGQIDVNFWHQSGQSPIALRSSYASQNKETKRFCLNNSGVRGPTSTYR